MRAFFIIFLLFTSPALGFEASDTGLLKSRAIAFADPVAVPGGALTDQNGKTRRLTEFKDEVSVVTLWATWCHQCHSEMPRLAKLAKARAGTQIKVRPVTIDDPKMTTAAIARHMKKERIDMLPLLRDLNYEVWNKVGARGTPTTLIIDRYNQIVAAIVGGQFNWTDPEVLAYLDALALAPDARSSRMLLAGAS